MLESTCEEDPVEYCQNAQAFCEALVIEDTSATARHQLREFYRLSSAAAIETNRPELCVETNLKYQDLIRQQIPSSTKDTKDIFELGLAHNEAGIVHALNKEFDAALKSFQKCADVWSSLENSGGIKVGLPLCNTGMVHTVLKQYDEASSSLVRAASNYAFTLEDDGKRFSSYMYVCSSASSVASSLNHKPALTVYRQGFESVLCARKPRIPLWEVRGCIPIPRSRLRGLDVHAR